MTITETPPTAKPVDHLTAVAKACAAIDRDVARRDSAMAAARAAGASLRQIATATERSKHGSLTHAGVDLVVARHDAEPT